MARRRERRHDRSASGAARRAGMRWTRWGLVAAVLLIVASRGPFQSGAAPSADRKARLPVVPLSPPGAGPPADSSALALASAALSPRFVRHESARFIALSDGSAAWTRSQLERFERAHHQFERCLRGLGIDPPPLRHKLVAVLFSEHRAFAEFASRVDGVTGAWVHAYYLPREDRVVAFDSESSPGGGESIAAAVPQGGWRRLAGDRGGIAALEAPSPRSTATAAMVHEAIHQLMFHAGLHRPGATPFWLGEGFAVAFETDRPAAAFGPDFDHPPRRREFERLLESGRLISLASFIEFERPPDDHPETIRLFYHQAGALLAYLYRERPRELRRHLEAIAVSGGSGTPRRGRFLQSFRESFGDPLAVEQAWLEWERDRLRRPRGGFDASP